MKAFSMAAKLPAGPLVLVSLLVTLPALSGVLAGYHAATRGSGRRIHSTSELLPVHFVLTSPNFTVHPRTLCAIEAACSIGHSTRVTVHVEAGVQAAAADIAAAQAATGCSAARLVFQRTNFSDLFVGTPLAAWHASGLWRSGYTSNNLSNAARLALLWRYGGLYLDTDQILLRDMELFMQGPSYGFIAWQPVEPIMLNNAMLAFSPRHPFVGACMQSFVDEFQGHVWGNQGPRLMTRVYKRLSLADPEVVAGIFAAPPQLAYPLSWEQLDEMFSLPATNSSNWQAVRRLAYGLHLWNNLSKGRAIAPGSIVAEVMRRSCPTNGP